jgi:hypothetical protein
MAAVHKIPDTFNCFGRYPLNIYQLASQLKLLWHAEAFKAL